MSDLTKEQLVMIERNKQAALEKRAAARMRAKNSTASASPSEVPPTSFYSRNETNGTVFQPLTKNNPSSASILPSADHLQSSTSLHTPTSSSKSFTQSNTSAMNANSSASVPIKESPFGANRPSNRPTISSKPSNPPANSSAIVSFTRKDKITGKCCLISRERFIADIGYHKQTIDIFKKMSSSLYDSQNKRWSFHLNDYHNLVQELRAVSSEVSLGSLPPIILQTFCQQTTSTNTAIPDIDLSRIDPVLVSSLMPFQREGVCFGISKQGRCLIADDMGLGKTIQALGVANYYKEDWPLLIVAPSSVRFLWEDAITLWLPSVPVHHIVVMTTGKDYIKEAKILILSYDLLSRHEKELKHLKFGVVIMDECHFLKNMKSARTKAGLNLTSAAKRVILLSGTPALSRPSELYSQMHAIDPKVFPWFQEFGVRYCDGKLGRFGWDFSGSSNMHELQLLLEARFMIRRLKSEVITQLPDKIRQMIVLNPNSVKSTSNEMKKYVKMLESAKLKGIERRGTLMEYYSSTGVAKLQAIQDYLSDLLESGQKFICFAHHKTVMDGICELIDSKKHKCIRIDGGTNPKVRQQLCDSFQTDNQVVAAVLSITAANAGITLTAAHLVVFAELFWNPGILTQAEDRAHRIGQQDSVVVQYLVARGTADDHIWPLIITKLDVLNKAGLSKDNFLDAHPVNLKDSTQKTIESYFEEIPVDWLDDGNDSWLVDVDLDQLGVPEKKPKLC